MRHCLPTVIAFFCLLFIGSVAHTAESAENPSSIVERLFAEAGEEGYEGCFLVTDLEGNIAYRSGEACAERFPPCSTFKIPNSLISLETGVIGPTDVLKWDGKDQPYKVWEKDHHLQSAISSSVVWFYQELARRVGEERMQNFVDRFEYGNRDLSGGIDRFWLGSTLEISADEQIRFLSRLYRDQLPISQDHVRTVRKILFYKGNEKATSGEDARGNDTSWALSAKTGSCRLAETTLGWWVGHVKQGDVERLFVTRITGSGAEGREARELTRSLLADADLAQALGLSRAVPK